MRLTISPAIPSTILALGLFFSGPVIAVECEAAFAVYGEAICENAAVNIPYSQMQAAYSDLALPDTGDIRGLMARDQEKWLDFAQQACVNPTDNPRLNYQNEQPYCISDIIVSRTNWLEHPWQMGGEQFIPMGIYGTKIDTVNFIGPPVGKYVFSAMLLDETSELSAEYNEYARAGYGQGALQPLSELSQMSGEVDSETFVRIYEITPERISSMVESFLYYHGAAHGTSYITYEHYLVGEKRGLVAGDIFAGENWQQNLQGLLTHAILSDETLSEEVWEDFSDALPAAVEPERWKFTPEGLEVQFQQYELTAYAYGSPVVLLPWKELRAILAPRAKRIVSNF